MAHWVIVGSNRGIGLEMCRQLVDRGERVTAVCRKTSDELDALKVTTVTGVDVCEDDDVTRLAESLSGDKVDNLVVVSGVLRHVGLSDLDFGTIRDQLEVNALGPLRVAGALRHLMGEGSKVGLITSRMGSVEDNTSGGSYSYRMSKAALNMAGKSLAVDLKPEGVAVMLLHPGFVRTEMTGGNGFVDPPEAAAGLLARIDELNIESTGTFFHANGEQLPW